MSITKTTPAMRRPLVDDVVQSSSPGGPTRIDHVPCRARRNAVWEPTNQSSLLEAEAKNTIQKTQESGKSVDTRLGHQEYYAVRKTRTDGRSAALSS